MTTNGIAIIDGVQMPLDEATIPVTDLGFLRGYAAFDTVRAESGVVPHLTEHLDRFAHSCQETGVGTVDRELLEQEVLAVAQSLGGSGVIRMTLTGSGRRLVMGWPPEPGRFHRPVRAATGPHVEIPFISGAAKHHSRMHWMVAVHTKGVDEVFMVDEDGRFTEGTTCGILAVVDGVLHTAAHDGRILASRTTSFYVAEAQRLGIEVRRQGALAAGPWDALYVASTTRKLAPVAELDGAALTTWDPVGRLLAGQD